MSTQLMNIIKFDLLWYILKLINNLKRVIPFFNRLCNLLVLQRKIVLYFDYPI